MGTCVHFSRSLPSNSWWQTMVGWQVLSRPSAAEGGGRRPAFTGLATQPYSATEVDGWQHKLSRVSQNRAAVQMGHVGHQFSHAPGRPVLHLVSSSRRPRQVTNVGAMSSLAPHRCSSFVRAMRPFLRPGLCLFQGTARRGRQGWPSRLAHLWLGISRPRLDGPEHGATLTQIGTPSHLSSHIRSCAPC